MSHLNCYLKLSDSENSRNEVRILLIQYTWNMGNKFGKKNLLIQ